MPAERMMMRWNNVAMIAKASDHFTVKAEDMIGGT